MNINSAEFIKSATHYNDCPKPMYPEYAFLGRSNVGKSSLINMLTGYGKLAKTSATPGKTRLINHFLINNSWYLADLPGFGFAKAPKKERGKWEKMIQGYLLHRENLICSFLLVDSRHEPQKNDMDNMEWFGAKGLPFVLVFTKTDKLSTRKLKTGIDNYMNQLKHLWDPLPDFFLSSSEKQTGKEEILSFISRYNKDFSKL